MKIDFSKIKAGINKVIIKLPDLNNHVKLNGQDIYLETKFEAQSHVPRWGEVVGLPTNLYFNKEDSRSMEWETQMELEKGDTVFVDYLAVLRALSTEFNPADAYPMPQWLKQDGFYYVIINYQDVFFRVGDEIKPINGYCIAKPIKVPPQQATGIILLKKEETSRKFAEIIYVGERCTDFVGRYKDVGEVEKGDTVLFSQFSNVKVENPLHQKLFDKEDYFVIHRRFMRANFGKKGKELVEEGVLK